MSFLFFTIWKHKCLSNGLGLYKCLGKIRNDCSSEMLLIGAQVEGQHLGDECAGLLHLRGVGRDSNQSIGVRVEFFLQTDDHDVHLFPLRLAVGGHLANVGVVKSGVDLVEDEEGGGLEAVDGEEQGQGGDGLLTSTKVRHRLEPLAWSNTVVVDPLQVRLLRVLWTQESLSTLVASQALVDSVDSVGDVLKAGHE